MNGTATHPRKHDSSRPSIFRTLNYEVGAAVAQSDWTGGESGFDFRQGKAAHTEDYFPGDKPAGA
jgi:hypothetical protein